jgi:hypothetical protein
MTSSTTRLTCLTSIDLRDELSRPRVQLVDYVGNTSRHLMWPSIT